MSLGEVLPLWDLFLKKYISLIFLKLTLPGNNNTEDAENFREKWNKTEEWRGAHGNYMCLLLPSEFEKSTLEYH